MRKQLILILMVFSLNTFADNQAFDFSSLNGKTANEVMASLKEFAVSKFNVTCANEPTGGQWLPDFNSNFTSKLECTSAALSLTVKASLKVIDKSSPRALYDKKVKVKRVYFDVNLTENHQSASAKQEGINDTARKDSDSKEKKNETVKSNKSHSSKNL